LKWPGGKHYLARRINGLFPAHVAYAEPFAGSLAVLLAKTPAAREVVGDLNPRHANFWSVLKGAEAFQAFLRLIRTVPFSEGVWNRVGAHLDSPDPVLRAAALFVRVRQSMGARGDCFSPKSTRLRRGMPEHQSAWLTAIDNLSAAHERLQKVTILCEPAIEVIRTHDGPNTLIYADPPYMHSTRATTGEYGAFEMATADHVELLAVLKGCKGKVVLSGYRSALYDAELAGWKCHEFELPNNAAGGKDKRRMTECLWTNF
jgi:DNA adenine methylase